MEEGKEVIFKVTRSIKKVPNKEFCLHRRSTIDEKARIMECRDCGAILDPFSFILTWANEEQRYEMEVEYLKRELTKLHTEKEELKKEISYMKRKKATAGIRSINQQHQEQQRLPSSNDSPF